MTSGNSGIPCRNPFNLVLNIFRLCLCNPPLGVIEEIQRKKPSCRTQEGKNCRKHFQCGRRGICTSNPKHRCKRPRYDGFFDIIEETGPNMDMDIEEYGTDLDYGILDEMELEDDQSRFYKSRCCCAKKIRSCRKFQGRKCKKDGECGKKGACECHCPPGVIAHLVLYETTPGGEWYCGLYPQNPTYCKCCCKKKNSDFCRDCQNLC